MALTTLAAVKEYLNITEAAYDDVLTTLVTEVSALIELLCDRKFDETTYRRWLNGAGIQYQLLPEYPIIRLDMAAIGRKDAATVSFDMANTTHASVQVDDTNTTLRSITAGAVTVTQLAHADYATLTLLEAAVELVAGWSMTVQSGYTQYPTADMAPSGGQNAYGGSAYLYVPYNVCDDAQIYRANAGMIYRPNGWPSGVNNIFVTWLAGYDTIPSALSLIAKQAIGDVWRRSTRDGGLQSERLGDYSWTAAVFGPNTDALARLTRELSPYIRMGY